MDIDKIIVVTRQTRLANITKRYNTVQQAKFITESWGLSFDDFQLESDNYQKAKDVLLQSMPHGVKVQVIDRELLPNFLFGPKDLVVTLGQDGLVVNTAKYLSGQPILAFNPDPERFDGILLPFLFSQAKQSFQILEQSDESIAQKIKTITMAKLQLNDGQSLLAFNDFFIGVKGHSSARYTLTLGENRERQSSSGVIISTPAGSTGWMSSVFHMASGMQRAYDPSADSKVPMKIKKNKLNENDSKAKVKSASNSKTQAKSSAIKMPELNWHDRKLLFAVREPFVSKWSSAQIVSGQIDEKTKFSLESHMGENGIAFSDGMESDYIEFNSGSVAEVGVAEHVTKLISN